MKKPSLKIKKTKKLSSEEYDQQLKKLSLQLSLVQQFYLTHKKKAVIVFEGVDAAGKGGLIRRAAWAMDPRGFHVWPIAAPTEEELGEHFLQRFWRKVPGNGSIAAFDRSWYGRVLVERIEEFTDPKDWKRGYKEIREFESTLTDNGCRVVKIFLQISEREQSHRFLERIEAPNKRWKLTYDDFRNRKNWDAYSKAFKDMFRETSTKDCPWKVIANDDQHQSRLIGLEYLIEALSKGHKIEDPKPDPKLSKMARLLRKELK